MVQNQLDVSRATFHRKKKRHEASFGDSILRRVYGFETPKELIKWTALLARLSTFCVQAWRGQLKLVHTMTMERASREVLLQTQLVI